MNVVLGCLWITMGTMFFAFGFPWYVALCWYIGAAIFFTAGD